MTTAGLMRSSAVMAAGTAASRALGFVRAALLAATIGLAASGDTFSVANTIPNALYILLAGGVLNAVLVPQITKAANRPDGGQEYIDRLLTLTVTVLLAVTVLVTAVSPLLIHLYATGRWTPEQFSLGVAFSLWCLPQVFWYGTYTMLGQVLNARGSFGPFMWAPVLNNVVGIVGLLVFIAVAGHGDRPISAWTPGTIALLCGTATLGVAAQALVLIPALRRAGVGYRPRWGMRGFGLRTAGRVAGWTFAAVVVQQLGFIVISQVTTAAQRLSSHAGHGAVRAGKAVYDLAFLIFMLPHSLVAVSLVTALFTQMSRAAVNHDVDAVRTDLSLGLRLTGVASVLAAGAFLALGTDFTRTLFAGNGAADTDGIAYVAMAMLIGLAPFSAQYLFQRTFYAFEDARTPFLIQLPVTLLWTAGNLLSLWLLPPGGIVIGVGISMSVANFLGAGVSAYVLRHRLHGIDGAHVVRTYVRLLVGIACAGAVGRLLAQGVHAVAGDGRPATLLASVLGGLCLVAVYVLVLRRLRVGEVEDLLGPLGRRPRKRRAAGRQVHV